MHYISYFVKDYIIDKRMYTYEALSDQGTKSS